MKPPNEQDLLQALRTAELSADLAGLEHAVGMVAGYYCVVEKRFLEAAPYWRRQAQLVMQTTSATSRELGTFLHNMAVLCLIPAGLNTEARYTLYKAKRICALHFPPQDAGLLEIERTLQTLQS